MNDNPAFGAGLQPFMGIPSFMRLPVSRELKILTLPLWACHLTAAHPTAPGRVLVRARFAKPR